MKERRPVEVDLDGEHDGDDMPLSEMDGEERGEKAVRNLRKELDGLKGAW